MNYFSIYFRNGKRYDPLPTPADWYWNPITGNDANTGKNPTDPFLTWSQVESNWIAGQTLAVAAGAGVVREEVVSPGAGSRFITYGGDMGYGTTTMDASDIALNASFSKTAGQTNVYQITVAITAPVGYTNWINVWEDDINMKYVTSIANCDSTPNSFYKTAESGSVTIYIHASDSSDITANSKVYTYSKRRAGVRTQYSGFHVEGICTQKNLQTDGSLILAGSCSATQCWAYFGSKHNIYYQDGCTLVNVHAMEANYNSAATMFIMNENTPIGLGCRLTGCTATITQVTSAGFGCVGFHGHINVSGGFGDVYYVNCTATGVAQGFTCNNCENVYYTNCVTSGCSMNGYTLRFSGCVYHLNGCEHVISGPNSNQIVLIDISGPVVNFSNCTFTADRAGQEGMIYATANCTINFLANNLFTITAVTGAYRTVLSSAAVVVFYSRGSRYALADAVTDPIAINLTNAGSTIDSDYNEFSHGQIRNAYAGTTYNAVADWQAAGYDINSTVG